METEEEEGPEGGKEGERRRMREKKWRKGKIGPENIRLKWKKSYLFNTQKIILY